jgi:hypothetical protein
VSTLLSILTRPGRSYRTRYLASLLLLLSVYQVSADFNKPEWQFSKPIGSISPPTEGYVRVLLDGQTYHQSRSSLSDLRIVDDQQKEIPYALIEEKETTSEEEFSPKIYNKSVLPGAYSTLILDLEREIFNNKLVLKTQSKNFKRRVEIAGSNDGKQWFVVKKDAYIFDFSGEQKVQLTTIQYPDNKYRYLQLKVWNGSEPPLKLEGACLFFTKTVTPKRVLLPVKQISREEDSKLKASVCLLDLSYQNLPCDFLAVETPEENFSRLVEIHGSNNLKDWLRLHQSEFYRFHTSRYSVEKKTFRFPEARHRYLKVIVYNYDDPPLRLDSFAAQGIEKRLIFQSQSGRQYFLFYGNSGAIPPHYDVERVKNYLSLDTLPQIELGGEIVNRDYNPSQPQKPWTERKPVLFWGILILLVVGLGSYIVRLMSKVRTA